MSSRRRGPAEATMKKGVSIAVSVLALTLAGCNSEQRAWSRATSQNTATAYDEYLKSHPGGPHSREAAAAAGRVRDDEAWQVAKSGNSPESYDRYLEQHREGRHAAGARAARSDAVWLSDTRLMAVGEVSVTSPNVPEVPPGLLGVVFEVQPTRETLTFDLNAGNTYIIDRTGRKASWTLYQPITHKGGRLLVEGHDLGGIPRPWGRTIMHNLECDRHTVTYHAGFITRIGPYTDGDGEFFRYPAIKPTTRAKQPLPLTVEIPVGSTRTMAVLFPVNGGVAVEGVYIAGHRLPGLP
jgi:hypothetical protein